LQSRTAIRSPRPDAGGWIVGASPSLHEPIRRAIATREKIGLVRDGDFPNEIST
jgi:hypothetical protein